MTDSRTHAIHARCGLWRWTRDSLRSARLCSRQAAAARPPSEPRNTRRDTLAASCSARRIVCSNLIDLLRGGNRTLGIFRPKLGSRTPFAKPLLRSSVSSVFTVEAKQSFPECHSQREFGNEAERSFADGVHKRSLRKTIRSFTSCNPGSLWRGHSSCS